MLSLRKTTGLVFSSLALSSSLFGGLGYLTGFQTNGSGATYVVDTCANRITGTIGYAEGLPLPDGGICVAFNPNGRFAYTSDLNGSIYVIDTARNEAVMTVANSTEIPFSWIASIGFSPDGSHAYIVDEGSSQIYSVDTQTNTATALVTLADGVPRFRTPSKIAFSPNGTVAYATDTHSNVIYTIDPKTNIATQTVNQVAGLGRFVQLASVAFSPDGAVAYVADSNAAPSSALIAVNPSIHVANQHIAFPPSFPAPSHLSELAFSPDGTFCYATDSSNNRIYAIDTATQTVTKVVALSTNLPPFVNLWQTAFTPDGTFAYLVDENNTVVYIINTATTVADQTLTLETDVPPFDSLTGVAIQPLPLSPNLVTGQQQINHFGLQYEVCNVLQWSASPSYVSGFQVYRNGASVAKVGATTFEYQDHNVEKGAANTYSVAPIDLYGVEGVAIQVQIQ